jgi:hypothetical protein
MKKLNKVIRNIFALAVYFIFSSTVYSQSKLDGRFFYNIESSYRHNDSSIIDVYVTCVYFKDNAMYSTQYSSCENSNNYYYNENISIKKNIKKLIPDFFSLSIDSVKISSIIQENPIGENLIYGFSDEIITENSSAKFFIFQNQLFYVYDEKWQWTNQEKTILFAENNSFYNAQCFIEFNNKYVQKKINKH